MDKMVLLKVTIVVLSSAIIVFFAQEFGKTFKRIFAIPGFKLFVPLIIVSWLFVRYQVWIVWILLSCQALFYNLTNHLADLISASKWSTPVVRIICLLLLALIPEWILFGMGKYSKRFDPWPYAYVWGAVLWIFAVELLLTIR